VATRQVVLLQFPNRTRFERWAQSPECVEASADRIAATTGSVVLVEGGAPPPLMHRGYADLAERVATLGPAAGAECSLLAADGAWGDDGPSRAPDSRREVPGRSLRCRAALALPAPAAQTGLDGPAHGSS
jgi:Domain of unknown function (DUF1330)